MSRINTALQPGNAQVVGSFAQLDELLAADPVKIAAECDVVELRLDLYGLDVAGLGKRPWAHLTGLPLLFTARRGDEGGAGNLSASQRIALLEACLPDAAMLDIEVASIHEMPDLLAKLRDLQIPWVASFHDFKGLPEPARLQGALLQAKVSGAAAFKAAVRITHPSQLAELAEFQEEDHGLPVASMGMGPLAPTSRLLCAQCGSVLNYGYLGSVPTAPGQWPASLLKQAVSRLG
ncbi:MAG TPA: type I 3-dehydroquinate dehydratase [Luteolibacter sp.]|nr:type I 3-dehydroquinate dehydratase [Luteolibacter sp.]